MSTPVFNPAVTPTIQLDYINITLRPKTDETPLDQDVIEEILITLFGDNVKDGYGFRGYKFSRTYTDTHTIYAWGGDFQRGTAHLSIPGLGASTLRVTAKQLFAMLSRVCIPHVTRIDIAVDVVGHDPFWTVYDNLYDYLISKRITKIDRFENYAKKERVSGTLYLGHKSSERILRIYTKFLKDEVRPKVTRFELMLKGVYASYAQAMINDDRPLTEIALTYFRDFFAIDFFVDLGSAWMDIKRPQVVKVRNTLAWLFVCAGAVADVAKVFGHDVLLDILAAGRRKRGTPPCDNMGVQLEILNHELEKLDHRDIFLSDVG